MKTLGKVAWFVGLLAVSSVSACKSDDDGDGGGGSLGSGVEPDKQGEDLTDDEVETLCEATDDYLSDKLTSDSFKKATCRYAAAYAAQTQAPSEGTLKSFCDLAYDLCVSCLEEPDAEGCEDFPDLSETEPADCSGEEAPTDCTSTVGEIEACFKATMDEGIANLSSAPSCDDLTMDSELPDASLGFEWAAKCDTVEENCPEVLE